MDRIFDFFTGRKRPKPTYPYDPEAEKPIIRASICTGEKVAGFRNKTSGAFHEVMLIRDGKDLDEFLSAYGLSGVDTEY